MALRISSSQLALFLECPYQYFLVFQVHPPIEVPQWIRKVFGGAVHRTIQLFYSPNERARLLRLEKDLTQIFHRDEKAAKGIWSFIWLETLKEKKADPRIIRQPAQIRFEGKTEKAIKEEKKIYFGRGINIVKRYWRNNCNVPFPQAVEKRFRVPAPHRPDVELVGFIDQIRKIKTKYWLIDLKTGWRNAEEKDARTQYSIHHDYQFTIYSWAFRQLYGKKEAGIIVYPLDERKDPETGGRIEQEAIITTRGESDYSDLAELIDFFISCLEKETFPKNYGQSCRYCDYLEVCASELYTTTPIPISQIDWGKINKKKAIKTLKPKAKELSFSQPRLKF